MLTLFVIALTAIISFIAFGKRDLFARLAFIPSRIDGPGQWYRFVSHALVHADVMHLIVNMLVLFFFGPAVEHIIAGLVTDLWVFVLLYFALYAGGAAVACLPAYFRHRGNYHYTSVGASGAIAAIVFYSIMFNPLADLQYLLLPGLPIKAFIFGILYLIYEYAMDKRAHGRVAHDAHFFGALFGVLFALINDPSVAVSFTDEVGGWIKDLLTF